MTNNSINRLQAIAGLKTLCREWEDALDGTPLAKSNAGLLLADVTVALGLTPDEQIDVLGYTPNLSAAVQPPIRQSHDPRQLELPQMPSQFVYV